MLTGTDGSVQKIIVSDWVKNTLGEGSLRDESGLDNIQNVKGNESYTPGGDNTKVWDAAGKDIYYQGNIDKQLPGVGISIGLTRLFYVLGEQGYLNDDRPHRGSSACRRSSSCP